MYKIEYLPIAHKDMYDIIYYISNEIKNPTTAKKLAKKFLDGERSILSFPYGNSIYNSRKKLIHEYRKIRIDNYLMFYIINENTKVITIVRVLYQKINLNNILE